jgi:hypothetical protein
VSKTIKHFSLGTAYSVTLREIMKIELILIMALMLIPCGIASSKDITLYDIIAGNTTANDLIADHGTSNFDESSTYTFIKDIGNAEGVEVIRVHFKNAFRGADQNLATIDRVWQVSDTNSSQVLINATSYELMITSGTPLKLGEGYELAIKSIDIDGVRMNLELSKNGNVIDSRVIIPPQKTDDLFVYSKDIGSAKDVKLIKVRFKNAFRGAVQNFVTIDRV